MTDHQQEDLRQTFRAYKKTLTAKMTVTAVFMAILGYIPFTGIARRLR